MSPASQLGLLDVGFGALAVLAGVLGLVEATDRVGRSGALAVARALLLVPAALILAAIPLSILAPDAPAFPFLRYAAAAVLIATPLLAAAAAWLLRKAGRGLVASFAVVALVGGASAMEAYFLGPSRLELVTVRVPAPPRVRLARTIRIALVADIQADDVGPHEARALRAVAAWKPDLLILAGDFLQVWSPQEYRRQSDLLRPLITEAARSARHGAFAVRGNVDRSAPLDSLFRGTGVTLLEDETRLIDFDGLPVAVTGLSMLHGFSRDTGVVKPLLPPPPAGGLHLAVAHSPDFAMAAAPLKTVDLALAGHTHGGQVVLPGIGPPITFSRLPRRTASGLSDVNGLPLVVTKGVGMERFSAPRIRFLCPPDVTLIEWSSGAAR